MHTIILLSHTLRARLDKRVVRHYIWSAAILVHLFENLQGHLPGAGLFAGSNKRAVGDYIAFHATVLAVVKKFERLTDIPFLPVGGYQCSVSGGRRPETGI